MNTVLFDLDGTLLPMNMKEFMDTYFKALSCRLETLGYEPKKTIDGVWAGTRSMYDNEGYITNEECFWKAFEAFMSEDGTKMEHRARIKLERAFNKFYKEDFQVARFNTQPDSEIKECVDLLKQKGYQVAVATNPLFPEAAIYERLRWAGFEPEEFALVTTYENTCFCKPNLNYYKHLLKTLDKDPEDCLMVGNNVHEDMCAMKIGMDVFLMAPCIINEYKEDTMDYKKGDWNAFHEYISALPDLN